MSCCSPADVSGNGEYCLNVDFLSMVKEKAEVLSQTALQSKAENLGMQMASSSSDGRRRGSSESSGSRDSERTDK